jgi:hypothetical protein
VFSSEMVLLKDNLRTYFEVFFTQPESYILEVLNDFILQCHQHGFIDYFERKNFEQPRVEEKDPRKVLTLYMLSAGFYIWLGSVFVACVVFVAEHVVRYFTRTRYLNRSGVEIYYELDDCCVEDLGELFLKNNQYQGLNSNKYNFTTFRLKQWYRNSSDT